MIISQCHWSALITLTRAAVIDETLHCWLGDRKRKHIWSVKLSRIRNSTKVFLWNTFQEPASAGLLSREIGRKQNKTVWNAEILYRRCQHRKFWRWITRYMKPAEQAIMNHDNSLMHDFYFQSKTWLILLVRTSGDWNKTFFIWISSGVFSHQVS